MKISILILFLLLISCSQQGIYDVEVLDKEGKAVKIGNLRSNGIVLYLWTGTCIGHTKDLRRLGELYSEGKIIRKVISVAIMMEPEDAQKVFREKGIPSSVPLYADPKGNLAEVISITFLPSTIIFDKKGRVIGNYPGLAERLITSVSSHD